MVRVVLVALALVIAVFAGWMVNRYLAKERSRIESLQSREPAMVVKVPTVEILIVTKDAPIASIITASMLGWQELNADAAVNQKYILKTNRPKAMDELAGSAARQPLFAGEPVVEAKLVRPKDSSFLAAVLREGQRAVSVKVSETSGVAGLILPGDRVDVLLTHTLTGSEEAGRGTSAQRKVGETIARELRVLAVDQAFRSPEGEAAKVGRTVTLEVDAFQAEALALGEAMGELSLSLRSAFGKPDTEAEKARPPTSDQDISQALRSFADQSGRFRVLVAARSLSAGVLLSDQDISWVPPPAAKLDTDFLIENRDLARKLRGSLLVKDIEANRPIMRTDLVRPSDTRFVPMALRPGMRAISIGIEPQTAVSGFITPGDTVDIIMIAELQDLAENPVLKTRRFGETIVRGVRCLSLEVAVDDNTGLPSTGGTATIEATPSQAETILLARQMGNLALALRPLNEGDAMAEAGGAGFTRAHADADGGGRTTFTTDISFSDATRWLILRGDYSQLRGPPPQQAPRVSEQRAPTITIFRGSAAPSQVSVPR